MKFTVVYKYSDEVKEYFERNRGKAYGDGINLVRLDEGDIVNKFTDKFINKAYAFRCKGSILSYLKHKMKYGKYATHLIGWK